MKQPEILQRYEGEMQHVMHLSTLAFVCVLDAVSAALSGALGPTFSPGS